MAQAPPPPAQRSRPAVISLILGILILGTKTAAWWITSSSALLADAMESIINVVAALVALMAIRLGEQGPDPNHPYGHGKIELVSAAFEGGLVLAAALLIMLEGGRAALWPHTLRALDWGMGLGVAAATANAGLGAYLLAQGKRHNSAALSADGKHVLSDVWTTVGALLGVGVVWLTGWGWLDGVVAVLVGAALAYSAVGMVRHAVDGLMDAHDPELAARFETAFAKVAQDGVHGLHRVRTIRSGGFVHVDAHVLVPAEWTVTRAHAEAERLEEALKKETGVDGDVALHLDPFPGPKD
jgi:cation diffusion facilitator family transporter